MPADLRLRTCTGSIVIAELLQEWKQITHALVTRGHAAELYDELNYMTAHGWSSSGYALSPISQRPGEICPDPNLDEFQLAANDAEIDGLKEPTGANDDASTPSLDETEIADNIIDEMDVPYDLIEEAADLSRFYHSDTSLTSEKILSQERILARRRSGHEEFGDRTSCEDSKTSLFTRMPPSNLPSCTSNPCESPDVCPITGLAQGIVTEVERKEVSGDVKQQALNPPQPTSPQPALKCSKGPRRLRVSAKQNLTANEIAMVASKLVSDDAISYFLHNSQLMSESRTPSCSPEPTISNNRVETTVVAALDRVLGILKGNRACRLLSRFAYLQLVWLIDAYKAAAASDRLQRKGRRRVGQRDASVAIDAYLRTKRALPGETLRRSQISGYCRTGRRWKVLAGRAPNLIFIFPQLADTIVYVSIPLVC